MICSAVAILLVAPSGAPASAETPPSSAQTVDARYTSLPNRPRLIQTDAHHAALVVRAGYRPRIMPPEGIGHSADVVPHPSRDGGVSFIVCIIAAALLGAAIGALTVSGRGRRELSSYAVTR